MLARKAMPSAPPPTLRRRNSEAENSEAEDGEAEDGEAEGMLAPRIEVMAWRGD
jgi:hypothetical protein